MKLNVRREEAGFSLVTAVIIITLLVFLGTMVLGQVANDVQLAGGDRAAMNAMYIAEAGAVWGKDTLTSAVCPSGSTSACVANPNGLTGGTYQKLPASYPRICPDGSDCSVYYALDGYPADKSYNNGNYTVAATCLPNCSGTPAVFVVRSYGYTGSGTASSQTSARLVEITVGY